MKKIFAVLVAAALSGVAVVGTSSSAEARWLGMGLWWLGLTGPAAAAAGVIAAWAGDRTASRPARSSVRHWRRHTITIRSRLIPLTIITRIRRRPITTMVRVAAAATEPVLSGPLKRPRSRSIAAEGG